MPKTITDIIPPSRRRHLEAEAIPSTPVTETYVRPQHHADDNLPPPPPPRPISDRAYGDNGRKFPKVTAVIALVLVLASAGVLIAFADASVSITPRADSATVSSTHTATFASGDLPYELISVEKTVSSNVPAESTETANDPATGTIIIMNGQAESQTLIKNTRFESPEGRIYRIQNSVNIPGGSVSSPGTVQATVYADAGGEEYNTGPTTFTIPGLAGSAAFDLVTARSEGRIEGGFSGTRPSVSEDTRDREHEGSRDELTTAINEEVTAQLKPGYVVIPGATFIDYTPAPDTIGEGNSVNVNLRGTATAVALPNGALAREIAYTMVGSYSGQPVTLTNPSSLTLTPITPGTPTAEQQTFEFSLAGNAEISWDVDAEKIAGAVAGKTREAAYTILSGLPEIGNAVLNIRPFWRGSFPDDPADITIKIGE